MENNADGMFEKLINKLWVKNSVLTVLPVVYGVCFPCLFPLNSEDIFNTLINSAYFWVAMVTLVLDIIAITYYYKIEHKIQNEYTSTECLRHELEQAKTAIRVANNSVRENAHMFHDLVFRKKGHSDVQDWRLLELKGSEICKAVHDMVKKLAKSGSRFSVSIMFKMYHNGVHGYTMLARSAPDDMAYTPDSYHSFIPETQADGYFYKKIFDSQIKKSIVLANKREIRRNFKDVSKDKADYSQFIAVPISCKGNKVVGILQIAALEDSIIAEKAELKKLAEEYFSLYATLMLLCDKYENVQQLF